jgi:hypothetical protein
VKFTFNFNQPVPPELVPSYTDTHLRFTDDAILDKSGLNIMMDWEDPLMKEAASVICVNGGDILNVGFGMGIIDTYIESYNPRTHWIIETHPDIQKKMIEGGWLKKPHVRCIFKPWQEVIYNLPKFDGIYFDTWDEEQWEFDSFVHNILKENGIYSFFNNPAQDPRYHNTSDFYMLDRHYDILAKNFNISYTHMNIPYIPEGLHYWSPEVNKYHTPICIRK